MWGTRLCHRRTANLVLPAAENDRSTAEYDRVRRISAGTRKHYRGHLEDLRSDTGWRWTPQEEKCQQPDTQDGRHPRPQPDEEADRE